MGAGCTNHALLNGLGNFSFAAFAPKMCGLVVWPFCTSLFLMNLFIKTKLALFIDKPTLVNFEFRSTSFVFDSCRVCFIRICCEVYTHGTIERLVTTLQPTNLSEEGVER